MPTTDTLAALRAAQDSFLIEELDRLRGELERLRAEFDSIPTPRWRLNENRVSSFGDRDRRADERPGRSEPA